MMRISAVLAAAVLSAPALAVDSPVLDMTVYPTTVGWTPVFANTGTANLVVNQLLIDSPINGFAGFGAPASLWPAASSNPAGWRIEATVNLTSHVTSSPADGSLMLLAGDGAYRHFFEIYHDHIALTQFGYTGVSSAPVTAEGQFHTYVISALGPVVTVTVDNVPVLSATQIGTSPGYNNFQFGDLLFANESHSAWTYVAFGAVPSPGAGILLALAGGLAGRRRR